MKKLLMIIVGLFVVVAANAQTPDHMSRLTLKDGLEMVGYVTEQEDGNYLLQTAAGDVFYYFGHEVTKIKEVPNVGKRKGWMGIASLGVGVVNGIAMTQIVYGYRFSPHFYLGLMTGLNLIHGDGSFPMGLSFISEFSKSRTSMYMSLEGGIERSLDGYTTGCYGLTVGLRSRMKNPDNAMWYGISFCYYGDYLDIALKVSYSF